MKKKISIRKLTVFLVVFLMLWGIFVPTQISKSDNTAYAGEVADNVITQAWITDGEGKPFKPGQQVGAWQSFRIYVKFKLPDNVVKENDTTTMTLPFGFDTAPPDEFQIKDGNEVIANAKMYNQNPAKIVLTYTKYAEEHSGIQGEFYFNVAVNAEKLKESGKYPVSLTVNGNVIPAGEVDYNAPHFVNSQFTKVGWMTNDKTEGKYDIRINQDNVVLVNAKFEDTIQSENVSFIEDSIEIWNGKWENHGSYVVLSGKKNVAQEFKDAGKIKFDGKKLTIDIGDYPESNEKRGFQILYKVKLGYEPIAGEEIKNKAKLTYGVEGFEKESTYKIKDAGGTGEGYTFKIQIKKVDEAGAPLQGAKFDVIRVRNKQKVGTITSGSNGEGEITKLLHDDYQLVETDAPAGYEKLTEPIDVKIADFGTNKVATKTITNKKPVVMTSVSVRKVWDGKTGDSVTVQLKKVGSDVVLHEAVLNKDNNWEHKYVNLPTSEADGTPIEYRVVEKDVPAGYTVSYEKDPTGVFIIKNTQKKISVTVRKDWQGMDNINCPTINVQLHKNGQPEGNPVELANGQPTHTWTDLDEVDAQGNAYKYSVKEVGESNNYIRIDGDWYKVTYGENQQSELTILNKRLTPWTPMEPPKRNIKVNKVWQSNSAANIAPIDKIEVELYMDEKPTGNTLELNESNGWAGEFKDLPVANGLGSTDYYQYTVKEVGETAGTVNIQGNKFKVTYTGSMKDGFTITNQKENPLPPPDPTSRDIRVMKFWKDADGKTIVPPVDKLTVELYKDGSPTGKTLELNANNGWTGVFQNLEIAKTIGGIDFYNYTVKEVGEQGNVISLNSKAYKVVYEGNMNNGLTITNITEDIPVEPRPYAPKPDKPGDDPTPGKPDDPKPNEPGNQDNPKPNNSTSDKPNTSNTGTNRKPPKTGDEFNMYLYVGLMLASGAMLAFLGNKRKKHGN